MRKTETFIKKGGGINTMPPQTVDEKRSCHGFCRGMNAFLYEREEILKKERKRRKKQGCRRGSPLPFG